MVGVNVAIIAMGAFIMVRLAPYAIVGAIQYVRRRWAVCMLRSPGAFRSIWMFEHIRAHGPISIMEGYAEGGFGGPFSCTPPADS